MNKSFLILLFALLSLNVVGQSDSVKIYIPQSFTPNGDGINDLFYISTEGVVSKRMEIYNSWGSLVYVLDDNNPVWVGNSGDGGYSQDNVYVWKLFYTDYDLKRRQKQGHVVVLR